MLPEYFEFTLPTKVVYGIGILGNIGDAVQHFGPRKAILVTDNILTKVGPVDKVKAGFAETNVQIVCMYDKVPPNSTIDAVEECTALAKEHDCDMVIAIGGGSVIDTAKVSNVLICKGGKLADHMGAYLLGQEKLLPQIFIPTTAGTGSEVTKVAVIADPANDVKLPFTEDQFLPDLAILDPEVTETMPPKLTAMTGMDALTHAIEAYVDKEWSPASDGIALHAIKMISENILVACAHPNDLQARGAMQIASFLAGVAFTHSMVGMVHGISHALGGVYHIPHGLANALVLPEVMDYNLESRLERYASVATALGVKFPLVISESQSVLQSLSESQSLWKSLKVDYAAKMLERLDFVDEWVTRQAAKAGVEKIRMLNRQLAHVTKMPLNLKEAGIKDGLAKLEQLASTAMEDGAMLYNPREPERDAVIQIVKRLYRTRVKPVPVAESELSPSKAKRGKTKLKNVFSSSEMAYEVLGEFYELLRSDERISKPLNASNLSVQFVYKNPSATITIDATGDDVKIFKDDYKGTPEVVMTLDADFAHYFWHGKANLVSALTRRQVIAKGNVPKTVKLLPILKPAFELYPKFLAEKNLAHLVV